MKNYHTFIPPSRIRERQPDSWSKEEAEKYFEWVVQNVPSRVDFLLDYFGESAANPSEILLNHLGKKVGEVVRSAEFVDGAKLTNAGFALAADLGLLVAHLLLKEPGVSAKWVLVTQKRNIHFNHPVIQGNSKLQLNPVRGSITEFAYSLKNGWDAEIWSKMFSHWVNVFSAQAATNSCSG